MHIKFPIFEIDKNKFQLDISLSLYAKDSIIASCYKFSDRYYIFQTVDEKNKDLIHVIFESKENDEITEDGIKLFCNELLDQQIRYNTNLKFGHIRDMIVKEAFKPVTPK